MAANQMAFMAANQISMAANLDLVFLGVKPNLIFP